MVSGREFFAGAPSLPAPAGAKATPFESISGLYPFLPKILGGVAKKFAARNFFYPPSLSVTAGRPQIARIEEEPERHELQRLSQISEASNQFV
jgi:hypothetical protein